MDIDKEMADLASNQIYYNALIERISGKFSSLQNVIRGGSNMSIFHSMNTTASALTAQRIRMDVISSNMANADTTRANYVNGKWEPYRSKTVVMEPKENTFQTI